jgi:metal-dependent amidase/aminoacylase/carboxypeptidase family protein
MTVVTKTEALSMHLLALALLAAQPAAAPRAALAVPDAEIRAAAERLAPAVVAVRRDLHAHPELGNREERTGQLVAERLRDLGLEVRTPVAKTGVVGILRGGRPGGVVALRADMDALPIEEANFQPAEEGAPEGEKGGAALMVEEGALDDPKVEAVFGLHVGSWEPVGQAGWSDGPIFASSDTFRIEVTGRAVHGAQPHMGIDPIPIAAEMVQALQLIVSRQIDGRQPRVLTIGRIQGGTRFNIIADRVTMEGTVRTHDATVRSEIKSRMARTVQGVAEAHGTTATLIFFDEGNPPTVNDAALARSVGVPALQRVFGTGAVRVEPQMVAEDFPFFGEKAPTFYFLLGTRNDAKGIASVNHTARFDVDEDALPLGVRAMATLAWDFLRSGGRRGAGMAPR